MMGNLAADLYQVAENEGIEVHFFPMPESKSMSLPEKNKGIIGLDNSKSHPSCEECVHLGHELGHCVYGGFYSRYTPFDIIEQHEYRADAWFFRNFIKDSDLRFLLKKGYSTAEMAEELGVTEEYIKKALHYWTECRGVDFNAD